MTHYRIRLELESDAAFGRGSGLPGLIDQDVVLDPYGCPYLHGRTLKGLLNEVCSEILYNLQANDKQVASLMIDAADHIFGKPGSTLLGQGTMRIGHARLPEDLRTVIRHSVDDKAWTPDEVTESLTTVRYQTALEVGGAPDPHTLRAVRVILRRTVFHAELFLPDTTTEHEKGLIAACVKGLRRAGIARNRGRGRLTASVQDVGGQILSDQWFRDYFQAQIVREEVAR
jgi:hypothetical protein